MKTIGIIKMKTIYEYYSKCQILDILELSEKELILKVKNQHSKIKYRYFTKNEFQKLINLLR